MACHDAAARGRHDVPRRAPRDDARHARRRRSPGRQRCSRPRRRRVRISRRRRRATRATWRATRQRRRSSPTSPAGQVRGVQLEGRVNCSGDDARQAHGTLRRKFRSSRTWRRPATHRPSPLWVQLVSARRRAAALRRQPPRFRPPRRLPAANSRPATAAIRRSGLGTVHCPSAAAAAGVAAAPRRRARGTSTAPSLRCSPSGGICDRTRHARFRRLAPLAVPASIEAWRTTMTALADALGLARFAVVGHHTGAAIARSNPASAGELCRSAAVRLGAAVGRRRVPRARRAGPRIDHAQRRADGSQPARAVATSASPGIRRGRRTVRRFVVDAARRAGAARSHVVGRALRRDGGAAAVDALPGPRDPARRSARPSARRS